jgi:hypothetical protein
MEKYFVSRAFPPSLVDKRIMNAIIHRHILNNSDAWQLWCSTYNASDTQCLFQQTLHQLCRDGMTHKVEPHPCALFYPIKLSDAQSAKTKIDCDVICYKIFLNFIIKNEIFLMMINPVNRFYNRRLVFEKQIKKNV